MGTCICETISNNQSETSEYEKESAFIFVIAMLFAVLWAAAGFTGIIACSCGLIAAISAIAGSVMAFSNRSKTSAAKI